jgi:transketolase
VTATRYEEALFRLASERPEVVVLTAENRAALRGLPERLGGRFIDIGICEATLVGAAAGLALRGRVPVVHALAAFLTMRAFEFIRTDVGLPGLPVKLVGGVPGFLSEANGPTHQAIEDVALMRLVRGMQIFCPADEDELVVGLPLALASPAPVYVRYNALSPAYRHAAFAWGEAEVVGKGSDVAILSYGALVGEAAGALEALRGQGISGRLVNLRTLAPLDEAAVLRAARETHLLVALEDHLSVGGLSSMVAELLVRERCPARLVPLGLSGSFPAAMLPDVIRHEGVTAHAIANRILIALSE